MSRTMLALVVALVLSASGWSLFGWEVSRGDTPHNPAVVQQRDPCQDAAALAAAVPEGFGSDVEGAAFLLVVEECGLKGALQDAVSRITDKPTGASQPRASPPALIER